jgi:putative ABC transport system permease protein
MHAPSAARHPTPSRQRPSLALPLTLLKSVSLAEWRHHPWRHALALLAVALGVALAFAVELINASALDEFGAAVRQVNGQPDFELRAGRGGFDETLYAHVAAHPAVALASPVIEIETYAIGIDGKRAPLRIVGIDAFVAAPLAPALIPRPTDTAAARSALLDPDALFLNAAAFERFVSPAQRDDPAPLMRVQQADRVLALPVRGSVSAGGPPLAVIDIAGAQARFDWLGRLSRIDVRLRAGTDRETVLRELDLPAGLRPAAPDEAALRVSNLSRAYRVNLTVLALVALFTGGFLVFSILALNVAQRTPQLALMGVLGLSPAERLLLVLAEAAALGLLGSALGLALGTALAWAALEWLAGDLGGGVFTGVAPALQWSLAAALLYAALGTAAAVAGAWVPARAAQQMVPAQAMKGLDTGLSGADRSRAQRWLAPALLVLGVALAMLPPIGGLPWAAYAAVAALLFGGIAGVPAGVALLLRGVAPPDHPLALVAVERARDQRHAATIAVAGVVASLALAVALTVMVASFRDAVSRWLDQVLPADLYARTAVRTDAADAAFLPPEFLPEAARVPGISRIAATRFVPLSLDATRPPVVLIARPLGDEADRVLPLVGGMKERPADVPPDAIAVYASEAIEAVYGVRPGERLVLPLPNGRHVDTFVRGVWRDYVRQHGAITIDRDTFIALTGDARANDLAVWLEPGAVLGDVQRALRAIIEAQGGDASLVEFATPGEIRKVSLRIFDRSFAVTVWLQAVAIVIGLAGVAASFSAQVLARRREFGLLAHLGFTRAQVLAIVAGEGLVWTGAGALLGIALGIAVSVVLVYVVNPQSFHWSMELMLPWLRLAALAAAVIAAGTVTATLAARRAAGTEMALAVKDDW